MTAPFEKTYSGVRGFITRVVQIALIIIGFVLIVLGRSSHLPGGDHVIGSGVAHADAASCSSCSDASGSSCTCSDTK